jgi:hypothetical protein
MPRTELVRGDELLQSVREGLLRGGFFDPKTASRTGASLAALHHRLAGYLLDQGLGEAAHFGMARGYRGQRTAIALKTPTAVFSLHIDLTAEASKRHSGRSDPGRQVGRSFTPTGNPFPNHPQQLDRSPRAILAGDFLDQLTEHLGVGFGKKLLAFYGQRVQPRRFATGISLGTDRLDQTFPLQNRDMSADCVVRESQSFGQTGNGLMRAAQQGEQACLRLTLQSFKPVGHG